MQTRPSWTVSVHSDPQSWLPGPHWPLAELALRDHILLDASTSSKPSPPPVLSSQFSSRVLELAHCEDPWDLEEQVRWALREHWPVLAPALCQSLLWASAGSGEQNQTGGRGGRDEVLELQWTDPLVALRQGSP